MAFNSDPILYTKGELYLANVVDKSPTVNLTIQSCRSFPIEYECITDVQTILNEHSNKEDLINSIYLNVLNVGAQLLAIDSEWAMSYFTTISQEKNEICPNLELNDDELNYYYYTAVMDALNEKEKNGTLTEEEKKLLKEARQQIAEMKENSKLYTLSQKYGNLSIDSPQYNNIINDENQKKEYLDYVQLAISHLNKKSRKEGLSDYETKLLEYYELEAKFYNRSDNYKAYNNLDSLYLNGEIDEHDREIIKSSFNSYNKNELKDNSRRKKLAKELNLMNYNFFEKAGQNILKLQSDIKELKNEWKEAGISFISGKGLGETWDATKKTVSTGIVLTSSGVNSILKVGELAYDGTQYLTGTASSLLTWAFYDLWSGDNLHERVLDVNLDEIRRDKVGELNKILYENTGVGEVINSYSIVKYNSDENLLLQNITEGGVKTGAVIVISIASDGTLAPAAVSCMFGVGEASENYTQSVDRENGEGYNYTTLNLRATAGGVVGYVSGVGTSKLFNNLGFFSGARLTGKTLSSSWGLYTKNKIYNIIN